MKRGAVRRGGSVGYGRSVEAGLVIDGPEEIRTVGILQIGRFKRERRRGRRLYVVINVLGGRIIGVTDIVFGVNSPSVISLGLAGKIKIITGVKSGVRHPVRIVQRVVESGVVLPAGDSDFGAGGRIGVYVLL